MRKFDKVSQNLQLDCDTVREANEKFAITCKVCNASNLAKNCDGCIIADTHLMVIAALSDKTEVEGNTDDSVLPN